ncbi:hypothetical protein Ddye_013614 [Dipteronia dyeriana]|uniref:RNase H type-1 domain-containing protein n=1 Tax=Dipteronia dyeriana TaxID=168575 RepID=A0AAE0CKD1_9ROSI|nr:hypothetical protein Ddye_013614 [Dipteronia dyeriana]
MTDISMIEIVEEKMMEMMEMMEMVEMREEESCVNSKPVKFSKGEVWFPPTSSSLKFNVDGSSRGNPGDARIGGVLRDHTGKVLDLFSEFVGTLDSITTEILAHHKVVSLCSNSPFFYGQEVDFISGSRVVVTWINAEGIGNLNHVHLIFDIRNCLDYLRNARVNYNPRTSNSFTGSLAKKCSAQAGDSLIWDFLQVFFFRGLLLVGVVFSGFVVLFVRCFGCLAACISVWFGLCVF